MKLSSNVKGIRQSYITSLDKLCLSFQTYTLFSGITTPYVYVYNLITYIGLWLEGNTSCTLTTFDTC